MATSEYGVSEYGIGEWGLVTFTSSSSQAQSSSDALAVFSVFSSGEAQQVLASFQVQATQVSSQVQKVLAVGRVGSLLIWDGSAWVTPVMKRWNGSAWVTATLKHWDGSQWL